jgi:hypothetical protein
MQSGSQLQRAHLYLMLAQVSNTSTASASGQIPQTYVQMDRIHTHLCITCKVGFFRVNVLTILYATDRTVDLDTYTGHLFFVVLSPALVHSRVLYLRRRARHRGEELNYY